MTEAPPRLLEARALLHEHLNLPLVSLGISGDTAHVGGGDSYHLGKDQIRARNGRDRYSVDESTRDQHGLDGYASAFDLGYFKVNTLRGTFDLRDYSNWLVGLCRANDPDTADLREVIYSPDGRTVRRWDRLGRRSTGDNSHLAHTHHSEHRDATGNRMTRLVTRWLQHIGLIPEEDDMTQDQFNTWMTEWASGPAGKRALGIAVLGFDPGADPKSGSTWPGVSDATFAKTATSNGTVGAGTALGTLLQRQAAQSQVLSALATRDVVDEGAVASALAPLLIAAMPAGQHADEAVVEAAIRSVFASLGKPTS